MMDLLLYASCDILFVLHVSHHACVHGACMCICITFVPAHVNTGFNHAMLKTRLCLSFHDKQYK